MQPPTEYDARYLQGIIRFNRGEFFEAHEVWEELWREYPRESRSEIARGPGRFVQGLIQAAVAIYHGSRGNRTGSDRLYHSARAYMLCYDSPYWGLDIPAFWQSMHTSFADSLSVSEAEPRGNTSVLTFPLPVILLDPPPVVWPDLSAATPAGDRPSDGPP